MKAKFLLLVTILIYNTSFSQKEAAIWYFGEKAGLDFNSGSPVSITNGKIITNEGCASISDKNGNILFYTDGSVVYNKLHQIMPNGSGLLGHKSSTQSAIIVPKPNNPYVYYIFTVDQPLPDNVDDNLLNDEDPPNNGLNYSQVDLRLDNGLGDISANEKNIHLITYNTENSEEVNFKCSEKITAVQHGDGISYWVITHFLNNFYAFKISNNGVSKTPILSSTPLNVPIGGYLSNAIGYLKISPNGTKLAIANSSSKTSNELGPKGETRRNTGNVWLFDFNSTTGRIFNGISIISGINPYGLEFSAKSKKLYITSNLFDIEGISQGSTLLQYNLKSNDIISSKTEILTSSNVAGALQLGIDEKIYRSGYPTSQNGFNKLSVINNPELNGTDCNFIQNQVDLKGYKVFLGLPPFITSLFLYSFNYESNCIGSPTHFYFNSSETVDSVIWDFGDGSSSTEKNTFHTYLLPGNYKVTLIKTVNGEEKEPIEKNITIFETPKTSITPYKIIQCDTEDSNSTDGLAKFNLDLAKETLLAGQKDVEIYYYKSVIDANNDINNLNSLELIYQNTVPNETIYAKLVLPSGSCYSIQTVILHANPNISILPSPLHECATSSNKAEFDLEKKTIQIRTELNLPQNIIFTFFDTKNDAELGTNPLGKRYLSNSKTLFIRAENAEGCFGTGQFDIIVDQSPAIELKETKILCEGINNFSILDSGIILPATENDFTYLWNTNETSPTIRTTKAGNYNVTVTNNLGCKATRNITLTLSKLARINSLQIKDLQKNNQVIVLLENPTGYLYKIIFENGTETAFQNNPIFENIPGGLHQLIIKNIDGCGQIDSELVILEAPIFFTPNGDGFNDYWNLKGNNGTVTIQSNIYIFDRYGKLMKQILPSSQGWDGTINGELLPADDYWFSVKLEDGREAKGHFSLKR
ncbi:T9SS type B sorting domain-containing protein [Flavobacterium sp.]|uniref:T9SS type B sorting domain-containing protein n=1 Tax=Flavobacterium sp. TaxID=239 RepID=UPI0025E26D56|nr:T9SS type B sorting domain-containing protein [Flavobacterium sp.]